LSRSYKLFEILNSDILKWRAGHHDYALAVAFAVMGLFWMVIPTTGIASTGVRLPTVRRRQVLWSGVTAVVRPQVWDANRWLRLRLADGELVTLKSVPVEHAVGIAKLAGVPTEVAKTTSPAPPQSQEAPGAQEVPDPDRTLTDNELERRFASVAERNRILRQQLRYSSGGRG
jgi:hypothetical protein